MLQRIRDRITGGVALLLLGLISIPFVFFGVDYTFTRSGFAAKVNGEEIPAEEVRIAYRNQAAQFRQLGDLPPEFDERLQQAAFDAVIRQYVLRHYLEERGYRVSDQAVERSIREVPAFQEEGRFSMERYRNLLAAQGYTPARFEYEQRRSLEMQQLSAALADTAFVTLGELRRLIEIEDEKRETAYALFAAEDFADEVSVTEEEISAWYEDRPERFRTEESADFRYIEINRENAAADIELSDGELEEYYASVAELYRRPEERRARHILITAEEDEEAAETLATSLKARVDAGEPFRDLARQYSKDTGSAGEGGDLGWVTRGQLAEPVEEAIFAMGEGEVRGPVESEFGFHVIRLDEIREAQTPPLEEVRAEVEAQYRSENSGEAFLRKSNELADLLFEDPDLELAAGQLEVELRTVEGYTRQSGQAGAALEAHPALTEAVLDRGESAVGEVSDLIELGDGRVLVLEVTDYRPAARRPLEEVRDEVRAALVAERARELARAAGEALLAEVRGGAALDQQAEAAGAEFHAARELGRDDAEAPPALVRAVFAAVPPEETPGGEAEAVVGGVETASGYAVYRLLDVEPGDPANYARAEIENRRRALARSRGIADLTAFVTELREQAEVVMGAQQPFEDQF